MEPAAWHLIRRGLTEKARAERNENMGAMPPLQAAITEMAIRELWDRVEALEAKRGPGRPPKGSE